jgi:hypothetical protein
MSPCIFLIIFFATRRHLSSILKKSASGLLAVRRQTTKREHKENISFSPFIKKLFYFLSFSIFFLFFYMETVVGIA